MNIWINGLTGDVDIINGLNHYIGMKHITVEMFPEFKFLALCSWFLYVAGNDSGYYRKAENYFLLILFLPPSVAYLAMYDFYQWGYDYGHNLDPNAPIQVPGLSYQPPLIGHKRLLNFDSYSFPDVGGWVYSRGKLALLLLYGLWNGTANTKKQKTMTQLQNMASVAIAFMLYLFMSCNTKPEPFAIGKDNCSFCKMGIIDPRFGGEMITKKGKIYKFDDPALHGQLS